MKTPSLAAPIIWTLMTLWRSYRLITEFDTLRNCALWIMIGDILVLFLGLGLAVYYWIEYAKGRRKK